MYVCITCESWTHNREGIKNGLHSMFLCLLLLCAHSKLHTRKFMAQKFNETRWNVVMNDVPLSPSRVPLFLSLTLSLSLTLTHSSPFMHPLGPTSAEELQKEIWCTDVYNTRKCLLSRNNTASSWSRQKKYKKFSPTRADVHWHEVKESQRVQARAIRATAVFATIHNRMSACSQTLTTQAGW